MQPHTLSFEVCKTWSLDMVLLHRTMSSCECYSSLSILSNPYPDLFVDNDQRRFIVILHWQNVANHCTILSIVVFHQIFIKNSNVESLWSAALIAGYCWHQNLPKKILNSYYMGPASRRCMDFICPQHWTASTGPCIDRIHMRQVLPRHPGLRLIRKVAAPSVHDIKVRALGSSDGRLWMHYRHAARCRPLNWLNTVAG